MINKILNFLKNSSSDYISGEEISHNLKISRQALWKHIHQLQDIGYQINAVPHLGYRLVGLPDKLLPLEVSWQLGTEFVGKMIHYYDSISSTMDIATRLGIEGVQEGAIALAETQTKGRGRLGREWYSPKSKGIYLSLLLRPHLLPQNTPILTLLTAVSICEAIKNITDLDAQIKWPNDILINQKKVGGILTEINAETDVTRFVVIGVGLNVNNDKKSLPLYATSLKEKKHEPVSRIDLLKEILRKIEINYLLFKEEGIQPILSRYKDYSVTLGRRVKIIVNKQRIEGAAIDIDRDGGLLIRDDAGLIQKVFAGDVVHCR